MNVLTTREKKALALYEQGNSIYFCADRAGLSPKEVLIVVGAVYRSRRMQDTPQQIKCTKCRWKNGDRPCVLPSTMCGV